MNFYFKLGTAVTALALIIGGSFYGGWKTRAWKDDSAYKALQTAQATANEKAMTEVKQQLEANVKKNSQIGTAYENRIASLTAQLKSKRVQYIYRTKGVSSCATDSDPSTGRVPDATQSGTEASQGEESVVRIDADKFSEAAVKDGVELESLQAYVNNVCLGNSK